MLAPQIAQLVGRDPAGVPEALDIVTGFDEALVDGLARLGENRVAALAGLSQAVAGTPLRDRVGDAVEKIIAGSINDERLTAVAGARAAILGAAHDALLARFDTALARTRTVAEPPKASGESGAAAAGNLLAGCRSWLTELALAGWRGVDNDLVAASNQTIRGLLAEPRLRRLAVLLDGMAGELNACCPVATMARLPVRRWADLWARALLLTRPGALENGSSGTTAVSGRLLLLGVDVHEHGTSVQVQVHGLLERAVGDPPTLVRVSVCAAKVDTIVGPAVWQVLNRYPVLLRALAERRCVELTDMPSRGSGDLVWREESAEAGEVVDPFVTARVRLAEAVAVAVPPLDRHPVRIAEPVFVEGYTTSTDEAGVLTFDFAGGAIRVALDRLPSCGPLTPALVAASSSCLGLVRWDAGGWSLQPFAVQAISKKTRVTVRTGDWAAGGAGATKSGDALAVLRERAGRLLRR